MKKTFLLIAALMITSACATPPPANREATPPAAASPAAVVMTEADAIAKEKAIWDTIKNKDWDAFGNMLTEDQMEVTGEGVLDKTASIASVKKFEPTEVVFSDWKFLSIDKDAFIVMYTANTKGKYDGKEFKPISARASSAWINRGGKWVAIYHQECPVQPPMPPAKTAPKSPASAAASPAASPVLSATGPDAIANEKMVWDLFQAKNWDAFAALLSPDFVEIEPDGVYDKAGTVKGVAMFDMSKAVLADFKSVNLDDDAALVTYTVKNAGPPDAPLGVRHSTIWVRRNGKWMGLFHQGGTAVAKPAAMAAPSPAASPTPKNSPASPANTPAKKS
jgi:hypothetical protein